MKLLPNNSFELSLNHTTVWDTINIGKEYLLTVTEIKDSSIIISIEKI